jgi:hypothetical protein
MHGAMFLWTADCTGAVSAAEQSCATVVANGRAQRF